jgi:hypothetical protein
LCGPIVIASFAAAYTIYNTKTNTLDWRTWPVGMFLVSWTFPLLFGFSNVDMWDNFHKFVILNIFLSIIILLLFYKDSVIRGKRLVVFMLLCLICSVPALADMTKNRFSSNITHHITPAPSITDIVFYLQQQPRHLIPYKNDISGLCDETGYSAIAQHANVPLAQSYFTNFLISAELETALTEALTWTDTKADRVATIQSLAPDHAIVIAKKHEVEFIDALNTIPALERRNLTYFSDYILYE